MSFKTIYITGIKKYQISVIKGLDKSKLKEGTDYVQGLNGDNYALIWIREDLDLKEFKLAIGSKFVWKHRMRFYETIDQTIPKENDKQFTEYEKNMIIAARNSDKK